MGKKMKTRSQRRKTSSVLSEMEGILPFNLHLTEFKKIAYRVQLLERSDRRRLLSLCEMAFTELDLRKDEPTRVAAAKVIVALVPDSVDAIRRWINTKSGKDIYEVHFSLFCFLDDVPDLPGGREFATEIPSLIEKYLLKAKSDSAYAAWMAGDLLGDHWETIEALPILVKAAQEARFVAGRESAIHGLAHILNNLPKSDPTTKSIITLLREISKSDRSENVKAAARVALETGCGRRRTNKKGRA